MDFAGGQAQEIYVYMRNFPKNACCIVYTNIRSIFI